MGIKNHFRTVELWLVPPGSIFSNVTNVVCIDHLAAIDVQHLAAAAMSSCPSGPRNSWKFSYFTHCWPTYPTIATLIVIQMKNVMKPILVDLLS